MADQQPVIATTEDELRTEALDRLKRKRDFRNHLAVFVLINASLWVIWAVTGAASRGPSSRSWVGAWAWPFTPSTPSASRSRRKTSGPRCSAGPSGSSAE